MGQRRRLGPAVAGGAGQRRLTGIDQKAQIERAEWQRRTVAPAS